MDVVSAQYAGTSIIYSENLAAGQCYGAIQIVNPLAEPALSATKARRRSDHWMSRSSVVGCPLHTTVCQYEINLR
jgi:hypothetical protein